MQTSWRHQGTLLNSICLLYDRYLYRHIGKGEGTAGMDIAMVLISFSAMLQMPGTVDFTGKQSGMTPAAFTASAMSRRSNPVFLQRLENGVFRAGSHHTFLSTDPNGDFYCNAEIAV